MFGGRWSGCNPVSSILYIFCGFSSSLYLEITSARLSKYLFTVSGVDDLALVVSNFFGFREASLPSHRFKKPYSQLLLNALFVFFLPRSKPNSPAICCS